MTSKIKTNTLPGRWRRVREMFGHLWVCIQVGELLCPSRFPAEIVGGCVFFSEDVLSRLVDQVFFNVAHQCLQL